MSLRWMNRKVTMSDFYILQVSDQITCLTCRCILLDFLRNVHTLLFTCVLYACVLYRPLASPEVFDLVSKL